MTRFARARGSKASNERVPEDSTPWEVMKEQLLHAKKDSDDSKNRKEAEQKRIENYQNFLNERKVQKRNATWCDFPVNEKIKLSNDEHSNIPKKKVKKANKKNNLNAQSDSTNGVNNEDKNYKNDPDNVLKKNKNKCQNESKSFHKNQEQTIKEPVQKNKKKQSEVSSLSNPVPDDNVICTTENYQQNNNNMQKNKQSKNKKNKKLVDGKPVRRKAINDHSFQLIINGKPIELVRFDGFPIMKADAERLQELKTSMIKKGIPKIEVQRTIKLERRRAEKALARVKKEVCYNCRKGGHVLSDCPELKEKIPGINGADGVCFKCGSTEHRQFECKVQKDKEFRFATCFICKEPGHIARQCPDNPKGLYPNGGSCNLCGDVTHLRKDCPTVMDKKEGSSIKLQTIESGENIEDVGLPSNKFVPTETAKKPKKIKF